LPPRGWARRGGGVRHLTGRLDAATGRLAALAGYTASGNLSQLARAWEQLPPVCGGEAVRSVVKSQTPSRPVNLSPPMAPIGFPGADV